MNKTLNQFSKTIEEVTILKEEDEASRLTEPILEGKWSIREIIGHLYYWDKFNLEVMVPNMKDGERLPEFPNHDQHNEEGIHYLREKTMNEIIGLFVETRRQLVSDLATISKDTRFLIGKGKRQYSSESFVTIFLKHDKHHLKQINEKLKRHNIKE